MRDKLYSVYIITKYKKDYHVGLNETDLTLSEAIEKAKRLRALKIEHYHLRTYGDYIFITSKNRNSKEISIINSVKKEFTKKLKNPLNGDLELSGIYRKERHYEKMLLN